MGARMSTGQEPLVLNLGMQRRVTNTIGAALAVVIGGSALGASIFGGVSGGLGGRIFAGIFGAFLLLASAVYIAARATSTPPGEGARLVIDGSGIRVDDPAEAWALRWDEIATVQVLRPMSSRVRARADSAGAVHTMLIRASRPDTFANHPELSASLLRQTSVVTGRGGPWLSLQLGVDPRLKRRIEGAVARFAPSAGR